MRDGPFVDSSIFVARAGRFALLLRRLKVMAGGNRATPGLR
jgi:hypothetical protein